MAALPMSGRVAIVTGAGRGLGRAYAMLLAARGARVVVNDTGGGPGGGDRSSDVAQGVVDEIRAAGGDAVASSHSVADENEAREIVQLAVDSFGTVDILVNNAGTFAGGPFERVSLDVFRGIVGVHLFGAANVTHAAWPILKAKRYGRVIMIVSSAGLWGLPDTTAYCAAKAGLLGLGRGLAHEGEPHNIKVNMVAPGAKTRANASMFEGKTGYTWRPELVAPVVGYLAGETCRHNGSVFAALAGQFARVEVVQAPGTRFDPRREITVEDLIGRLEAIDDLEGARALADGHAPEIRNAANLPATQPVS